MRDIKIIALLAVLSLATPHVWAYWGGDDRDGSEAHPWQIASVEDWNDLVNGVNGGQDYSGVYFRLGCDLTVTTMVGVPVFDNVIDWKTTGASKPFRGHFDGNGYTLTVDYDVCSDERTDEGNM